jgi:single-strand DNA-binding protein
VRCVAWGKLAEVCGQHLTKGTSAYTEGRLQTRKYGYRDGNERTVMEIVVLTTAAAGRSKNGNGDSGQATPKPRATQMDSSDQDIAF